MEIEPEVFLTAIRIVFGVSLVVGALVFWMLSRFFEWFWETAEKSAKAKHEFEDNLSDKDLRKYIQYRRRV